MAVNTFPVGFGGFQDGSGIGGGVSDPHLEHDEVKTYSAGVAGEVNNIYIDNATDTLYIYHTGAYHEVSGSGADAFQTYINRANIIEDVEPTIAEVPLPLDNSTAEVNLNGEIIERWVHDGTNWIKSSTMEVGGADGNNTAFSRGNTTINVAPTVLEVVDPTEGDTAIINLNSEIVEHWSHDGTTWTKTTSYELDRVSSIVSFSVSTAISSYQHRELFLIDTTTSDVNIGMPFHIFGTPVAGTIFTFKWLTGANTATLDSSGGFLIDGSTSFAFGSVGDAITIEFNGVEWSIISSNIGVATQLDTNVVNNATGTISLGVDTVADQLVIFDGTSSIPPIIDFSTAIEGEPIVIKFTNNDVFNRAYDFSTKFKTEVGEAYPQVVIAPNTTNTYVFLADSETSLVQQNSAVVADGGLPQSGLAIASLVEQGIYFIDGLIPVITLPLATGSQDRYMLHSEIAGVDTVIAIQLGDLVNGTLNGNYIILDDSEINLFIDSSDGNWVMEKMGQGDPISLAYAEFGVTTTTDGILCPFDTIVYEKTAGHFTTDGVSITCNKTGQFEIKAKIGVKTTNPDIQIQVNGVTVKTVRDGSIENRLIAFAYNFTAGDVITAITDGVTSENWLAGADSPATDMNYSQIIFSELVGSAVVNIEGITPVELHYFSYLGVNNTPLTSDGNSRYPIINVANSSIFSDPYGLLDNTGTHSKLVAKQDGKYEIDWFTNMDNYSASGVETNSIIRLNGVIVARLGARVSGASNMPSQHTSAIVDMVVGDEILVELFDSNGTPFDFPNIYMKQLATHSVNVSATGDGIDTVLSVGEALTTDREISLGGNTLQIGSSTTISNEKVIAKVFASSISTGTSAGTSYTIVEGASISHARVTFTQPSVLINYSINNTLSDASYVYKVTLINGSGGEQTYSFDTDILDANRNVPLDITLQDGEERLLTFTSETIGQYIVLQNPEFVIIDDTYLANGNISIGDLDISDHATSNYFDIGKLRIAWGKTSTASLSTVTFPAGGFAVAPSVTMGAISTVNREMCINSISATNCVLESGGSLAKTWQAIGRIN